jgi:hypothetical protein
MPTKAGIQKGFPETLDSRLRGNNNIIECNAIFLARLLARFRNWRLSVECEPANRPLDRESKQ